MQNDTGCGIGAAFKPHGAESKVITYHVAVALALGDIVVSETQRQE